MKTHIYTHTPGPWSVETKGSRHFIDGADELTVAYVDRAGVRERQTYQANAQLIAAAPDLLAALVEMLEASERPINERWFCNVRSHARAAIAKAEGRE